MNPLPISSSALPGNDIGLQRFSPTTFLVAGKMPDILTVAV